MSINWCPSCKTGLANEEVIDGRCERCESDITKKPMEQWMLKITQYADRLLYDLDKLDWPEKVKKMQANWIGRSEGTEITFKVIGTNDAITVFTTRADTICQAAYIVIAPEHPLAEAITTPGQKGEAGAYTAEAMRKSNIERMSQGDVKTGVFTGSCARNPANNEPVPIWISDYVLMDHGTGAVMGVPGQIEGAESDEYSNKDIINSLYISGYAVSKVIYKLRDWVFTRQRYWGEPIPIVFCSRCGEVPVPEEELPVMLPYVEKYQPSGTGESPLAVIEEWVNTKCPNCGKPAKRETNTMPQWAGSSWYFLRYCDPKNIKQLVGKQKSDYWLPVDFYIGGNEHAILHLLYARFYTKFLYDIGIVNFDEPFTRLFNIGMINKDGYKMSKSKPNCVSSDDIVNKYGADTLRMYEMFMGPPEQDSDWSESGIDGVYRFLGKVWAVSMKSIKSNPIPTSEITKETQKLIKGVTERLESQKVNTAISLFMSYINVISKSYTQGIDMDCLGRFITLLAPFVPHFAEEIWEAMGNDKSIFETGCWPKYDEGLINESTIQIPVQINGKVRDTITISKDDPEREVIQKARSSDVIRRYLEGRVICKEIYVLHRVVNLVASND